MRFLAAELPDRLRRKVINHEPRRRQDYRDWQAILDRHGWAAPRWPAEYRGVDWTSAQRQIFDDDAVVAGAPESSPFGLRLVGPVRLEFGTPARQARYLPRIVSGED